MSMHDLARDWMQRCIGWIAGRQIGREPDQPSHTGLASSLSCRNCHAKLDYTDVSCPSCGRKTIQFSLRN